jgi:hypothetical protein
MDADRLKKIDKKIKRYEGIDALLKQYIQAVNKNPDDTEKPDGTSTQNLKVYKKNMRCRPRF